MNVLLSDPLGGPGAWSGYHQLLRAFAPEAPVRRLTSREGLLERLVGKAYSTWRGWPPRNQSHAAAEWRLGRALRRPGVQCAHVLVGEYHLPFLASGARLPRPVLATLHFPPRQWTPEMRRDLRGLSGAIVLYQRDRAFFEEHVGAGRVRFVPHGVWTDFFRPGDPVPREQPRLLFAGQYLRNSEMLQRVVQRLVETHPELRFDLLVPAKYRERPGLRELRAHPAVAWHTGLDDEQMRTMYRRAYLHLIPMEDSGANNAIVESMACGTPVATTDVGGIRDYGGGDLFPVVENNDDDALCALVERYLADPAWRDERGAACRRFAEERLAWPLVAQQHLAAYAELAA